MATGRRILPRMNQQEPAREELPFDDYPSQREGHRAGTLAVAKRGLRILSALAMGAAFVTAAALLALDAGHMVRPEFAAHFKSAIPLICIGVSYASLQFTLPRSGMELCLGLAVSLAFVLWGAEQFIPAPRIAGMVDDAVVFLFVLDLSIVIRGKLRNR
ncbi:MAG TPA: hypothetical protein VHY22_11905 [Chthoniobacteraceae bacterium]|jgi:hypothetical protein|nr:hypothetical protein [Chthoniobacteraceae bacterium]